MLSLGLVFLRPLVTFSIQIYSLYIGLTGQLAHECKICSPLKGMWNCFIEHKWPPSPLKCRLGLFKLQDYHLRLLDTYASKIAKFCDLKTFWPLFQLINHLFNFRQKVFLHLGRQAFCRILKSCFISWITSPNVQKLQIFAPMLRCLVTLKEQDQFSSHIVSDFILGLMIFRHAWLHDLLCLVALK